MNSLNRDDNSVGNDETAEAYSLAELQHVRDVYAAWAKETAALERYALVTSGAIWSWCATHTNPLVPGVVLLVWAPLVICVLFGWRARAIYEDMKIATGYLENLEIKQFGNDKSWHNFLRKKSTGRRARTATAFWWGLIPLAAAVAIGADWYLLKKTICWLVTASLATVVLLALLEILVWRLPTKRVEPRAP